MDISPPPPPEDRPQPPGGQPSGPPPPPPAPSSSSYGAPAPPYEPQGPYGAPPQYPQYPQASPYGGSPYTAAGPGPYQPPQSPYAAPGGPGMPGPYPYPYPAPQQGWYGAEQTTNGLSIASLVTAFTCIPLLAGGLGIAGLKQGRRRGQRGRGLAIAGITINAVVTVLVAVLITLGAMGVLDDGNTKVEDIKPGDCFNTVGHSLSDYEQGKRASNSVDVVSCDKEHDAEAFYTFTLDPSLGRSYPGVTAISGLANSRCAAQVGPYLDGSSLKDGMRMFFYAPPKSVWDGGDRSVTCFFGSPDGKVAGSVRSGGGTSDGSSGGASGGSSSGGSQGGSGSSGGSSSGGSSGGSDGSASGGSDGGSSGDGGDPEVGV